MGFNAGHSAVAVLLARPASPKVDPLSKVDPSRDHDLFGGQTDPLSLLSIDVAEHPYVARYAALNLKPTCREGDQPTTF